MERTLDASYETLAKLAPPGFSPALLAGLDAGMMVRPADRPQSIAAWRSLLGTMQAPAADATVVMPKATPVGAGRRSCHLAVFCRRCHPKAGAGPARGLPPGCSSHCSAEAGCASGPGEPIRRW